MSDRPPQRLLDTPSWLLTQIAAGAGRRSREVFDSIGAGRYHYAILCAVEEFQPCSQAEIGRRLHIDRKDVAQRVGELEEGGYVEREPDPADPRRNLVRMTRAGAAHLQSIASELARAQDGLLAPLSVERRANFVTALQQILDR